MNEELWHRILNFNPDLPLAEYGFSIRLASENGWTANFTRKALLEYKKFIYLAATAKEMVSPSEIVDVVWHQHLIFTRSYTELCAIAGKNIQHIPSTHSKEDNVRLKQARIRTRLLYDDAFGEQPKEIWDYDDMLAPLELTVFTQKADSYIVAGVFLFLLLSWPFYHLLLPVYVHINNPDFIYGYIGLFACAFILLEMYNRAYLQKLVGTRQQCAFIHDLTPLELVCLKTGRIANVIHGIVNELIKNGKIVFDTKNTLRLNDDSRATDVETFAVLDAVKGLQPVYYSVLLGQLVQKPVFVNIAKCMGAFKRYVKQSKAMARLFCINFVVLMLLLEVGFVRLLIGLTRHKPVDFIALTVVVAAMLTAAFLWRTVNLAFSYTIPALYKTTILPAKGQVSGWDWEYFLAGEAVFLSVFLPLVNTANSNSSSAGGCGNSCGSGCGGGGGCGGCGGGD
jgi:uncharacterized protein (TIGR04222 family)